MDAYLLNRYNEPKNNCGNEIVTNSIKTPVTFEENFEKRKQGRLSNCILSQLSDPCNVLKEDFYRLYIESICCIKNMVTENINEKFVVL